MYALFLAHVHFPVPVRLVTPHSHAPPPRAARLAGHSFLVDRAIVYCASRGMIGCFTVRRRGYHLAGEGRPRVVILNRRLPCLYPLPFAPSS